MKLRKLITVLPVAAALAFTACGVLKTPEDPDFKNPGDYLGGGGEVNDTPSVSQSENAQSAKDTVGSASQGGTSVPAGATPITEAGEYSDGGDYVVTGTLDLGAGTLAFKKKDVHLYLKNATITSSGGKAISSKKNLTITLIGENSAVTTAEDTNAITCDADLTFNGAGSLTVASTKNAVKGGTITVTEATLDIEADGDGLHAEIDAYDDLTEAPEFSYDDGGWVFIDGASVTIDAGDDGIQADTFVYVKSGNINIQTNGGAPQNITEASANNADGKGIKAGAIDWGKKETGGELTEGDYLILIEGGNLTVNSNDDALHSDCELRIDGGTLDLTTGDDGVHAEELLTVTGGSVTVTRSYEGIEAAKVEISGGIINVTSKDDGINGADGTNSRPGQANPNCHIIISGGEIYVNAEGDGIDSNGTMLFTGGKTFVAGPTSGANAALDSDGGILVNGGYLFAVGPIGMVETPASNSEQNVLSYAYNTSFAAGTNLTLTDNDGNAIFSFTSPKKGQSVILSCPELTTGGSFILYGGESKLCSFTVSSTITTVGSSGGMQNPGGPNGGGGRPGRP